MIQKAARLSININCIYEVIIKSSILAAFEAAINDNVDIINLSMGSAEPGFMDSFAVGSFQGMKIDILTIASAGNTGLALGTVSNVYPWVLTVAASTIEREFFSNLLLGNNITIKASRYFDLQVLDSKTFYPLITCIEVRLYCQDGSLDANKVVGKVVVCGYNGTIDVQTITSISIKKTGGIGLIFVKEEKVGSEIFQNVPRVISAALISYNDGKTLFSYINSTKTLIVSFGEAITSFGIKSAPIMADFSSRGPQPHYFNSGVSKPNVTAPDVDILAATSNSLEKKKKIHLC
ncbi:subtilisin-like protease SBT5.3 [Amaranthus tricolor]|uniref:subtilisin-like protease SBT5.3 n=1 Tax=Amaranthus tricolor TaxID=29722 RepID=UPI002590BB8C|nr:subtilisin-like protease SBT5.3 [Amaranthus tricolor]